MNFLKSRIIFNIFYCFWMFANKIISGAHISESKTCFNLKPSTCYFHMKTKILADFQIYISLPLKRFCNMSNCMMSKTHTITKIFHRAEHTDTLNTWRIGFIIIIILLFIDNNVVLILFFSSCQASIWNFSKHYSIWKMVSITFRKTVQKRRLPILKIPQGNPQNNFLNFVTS